MVNAFLAAARAGDFTALVKVLDPDVVLRADAGGAAGLVTARGARAVAKGALGYAERASQAYPVLVNGAAGLLVAVRGRPAAVLGFTVRRGAIAEVYVLTDPGRLQRFDRAMGPTDADPIAGP